MVTTLFMWLVGNQTNKVFVIPCSYKLHFYVILFVPLKLVEVHSFKSKRIDWSLGVLVSLCLWH